MASAILHHSRRVTTELQSSTSIPGVPLLSQQESAEHWLKYEHLLYSCLTTRDDKSASLCLERLEKRFGPDNEKVKGLRGVYNEALVDGRTAEDLLKTYEKDLVARPADISLAKRRIVLLKGLGKQIEAINALNRLLEISPTDIEAWSELAETYVDLRLCPQALYCIGEVLLVLPNAWNIHARYGEICLTLGISNEDKRLTAERLIAALEHYARSLELCKDYIRGACGLKRTTTLIKQLSTTNAGLFDEATLTMVDRLHQQVDAKLHSILDAYPRDCQLPEILAVKLLLD